jgi:hypothetical protein
MVAKEVMLIICMNTTSLSIEKFLESPFAGKHPKLISKGTKAAAVEAAVAVAEAIAVPDLEEAERLAAEFEALSGAALTMTLAQKAEPRDPCASAGPPREKPPQRQWPRLNSLWHAKKVCARAEYARAGNSGSVKFSAGSRHRSFAVG